MSIRTVSMAEQARHYARVQECHASPVSEVALAPGARQSCHLTELEQTTVDGCPWST